jgi:hypothetical protein
MLDSQLLVKGVRALALARDSRSKTQDLPSETKGIAGNLFLSFTFPLSVLLYLPAPSSVKLLWT